MREKNAHAVALGKMGGSRLFLKVNCAASSAGTRGDQLESPMAMSLMANS